MFNRPQLQTLSHSRLAASIEVAPRQIETKPELLKHIPPATRTYIVDLGQQTPSEWADLACLLARHGLEPVPHIAACRLKSKTELAERLAAMTQDAGVRDVLLIAGEATPPDGPFASTMDVLATGLLGEHGITRVAIAGHPEGNPSATDRQIRDALIWKQNFARETELDMRIVTQFGFQSGAAIQWARDLQEDGIDLPVHLGVAGPANVTSLLKFAAMCGVKASSQFMAKKGSAITSLVTNHSPEPYVQPVEEHVAAQPASLIKQFHVFPFGGIARTSEWLCSRGSWAADARAVFDRAAGAAAPQTGTGGAA